MTNANYVTDLETKLHLLDARIRQAAKLLESGNVADKAQALNKLAHFRQRHEKLAKRIEEAKAKGAAEWSVLHTDFQKDADALKDMLERWLTQYD